MRIDVFLHVRASVYVSDNQLAHMVMTKLYFRREKKHIYHTFPKTKSYNFKFSIEYLVLPSPPYPLLFLGFSPLPTYFSTITHFKHYNPSSDTTQKLSHKNSAFCQKKLYILYI